MKKIYLLSTIIILFCNSLYSQWAPIGAKWIYTLTFYGSNNIDTSVVRSVGDTLIQGNICKILIKSAGNCDLRPVKEFMYEDSGKVFFYDESRNIFQMLYDFNGNIGDSTVIYPGDYPSTDYISVKIDSISSININSHILKKLFVHYSSSSFIWTPMGGDIIENIGNTYYMFPWTFYGCDGAWSGPLRCYEDTVVGAYNFNTAPSCDYTLIVGINETNNPLKITIFPNPVSEQINIEANIDNSFNYNIYNIFGLLKITGVSQTYLTSISTSSLCNGIYNVVIEIEGKIIRSKFIVLH